MRTNRSVYFDVKEMCRKATPYGKLSGRVMDDLLETRELEGRDEKKNKQDFAVESSTSKHIMRWNSPWEKGFPAGILNVLP